VGVEVGIAETKSGGQRPHVDCVLKKVAVNGPPGPRGVASPAAWPHSVFIHHRTLDGKGTALFSQMPVPSVLEYTTGKDLLMEIRSTDYLHC